VNLEGRRLPVVPLLQPPASVRPYLQTFVQLAGRMGENLSAEAVAELARLE
jgi:hypothetical protein